MVVFAVKSKGDAETKISDGIHQAYTVAAGMRTFLVGHSSHTCHVGGSQHDFQLSYTCHGHTTVSKMLCNGVP